MKAMSEKIYTVFKCLRVCNSAFSAYSMMLVLTLSLTCAATPQAQASNLNSFDENTWATIERDAKRPLAVVFTTTDCSHCPHVIKALHQQLNKQGLKGRLWVVVIDGQENSAMVTSQPHYRVANKLFAFDGEDARIRYSVNSGWVGVTPYVALLNSAGENTRFVMGEPQKTDYSFLLKSSSKDAR